MMKVLVCLDSDADRLAIDKGVAKQLGGLTMGVPLREAGGVPNRRAAWGHDFTQAQLDALTPLLSSVGLPPSKVEVLDTLPPDWRWPPVI